MITYNPLFASDEDAIYVMDLDGFFIPLNPACEQLFGYEREQFCTMTYMKVLSLEHLERALSYFYQSLEGKLQNFDCQIIHQNGQTLDVNMTMYPILIKDKIVGVYGVAKNITEIKYKRKQLMDQIQQREEIYREIVEHSPDAVIIAAQERILFANDTAVQLFGVTTKEEIMGRNLMDFLDPSYLDIAKQRINEVENGQYVDFIEEKIIRNDGETVEVEVKAIPTIFQHEPARHIIIRDITERKKTQQLLLQSEKLSAAGQLAAGIAHEIRNPLTAVKGFIQLVEDNEQEEIHSYCEIIKEELKRIDVILTELLVLAKPQELKFEKANVMAILEHVKALLDTQANLNNTEITIQYLTTQLDLNCDENQLKQVFINFLKNSIEAMPNGGNITIKVASNGTGFLNISLYDQGCGIPQEHLDRIGQPFFSTKEGGTGLGLMISKQIIENHSGQFHISSNQSGTIIEVMLPYK
ncbi:PAS domain S-box protein [Bacillus rubiinfantis]|uniref:PAS domain S-box protein n=1 Tax=Bacillus rubiinfantis TaxID=1499680 RepID=UPI001CA334AD|nr:PAS domain S-box protein [Bacillus rubiinfantis]